MEGGSGKSERNRLLLVWAVPILVFPALLAGRISVSRLLLSCGLPLLVLVVVGRSAVGR